MTTSEASTRPRSDGPVSVDRWASLAVHQITLPTGAVVKVRLPDLSRLIRNDALPEKLRQAALQTAFAELDVQAPDSDVPQRDAKAVTEERLKMAEDLVALTDQLVVEMMVDPKITRDDIEKIPGEDRDMLVEIAQRERKTDALGVRLGVAPLSAFHEFRVLHGCDKRGSEGCEACQALQDSFSTASLGGV